MGNTNVMTEVDQMVMFYLMTRRRINLVRLILDYMLSTIDEARKSHAAMPYGMLLTHVFTKAQRPIDGHRKDEKCPTTTKKTFSAMGLNFQYPDTEGEKKKKKKEEEEKKQKKKEEKKELKRRQAPLQKVKSKPSEEIRMKRRHERSLFHVFEENRVSKRRLLKLAKDSSSSSAE